MRHVHSEALRNEIDSRTPQSQVFEVLDLIEPVVDVALFVQRRRGRQLHDEVPTTHTPPTYTTAPAPGCSST